MDGLIYDEEQLPEIEVEELLTLHEMVQHQPSFVAFTPSELHVLIQQLTGITNNPRKADVFYKLHSAQIAQSHGEIDFVFKDIVCTVDAKRMQYEEEDHSVYTEQIQRAKNAPNYTLQQHALHKLGIPFRPSETSSDDHPELSEVQARIVLEDGSQSVLLPLDPVRLRLLGAQWQNNTRTCTDYVMDDDHIPTKRPPVVEWNQHQHKLSDLGVWIHQYVRPKLSSVMEDIPENASLHDMQRILARFGYLWNCLTQEETQHVKEHTAKMGDSTTEEPSQTQHRNIASHRFIKKHNDFFEVLHSLEQLIHSRLSEDAKQRLEDVYGAWMQSIPPLAPNIALPDPYELALQISEGSVHLDETVEQLRQWYQRWDLDITSRFMDKLRNTTLETVDLLKYAEKLEATSKARGETRHRPFLSIHSEIQEIKAGSDTLFYDGQNTLSALGFVFDELAEPQGQPLADSEPEDDEIPTIPSDTLDPQESLPFMFQEDTQWSDGTKEVATFVWHVLQRVKNASGLPCSGGEAHMKLLLSRLPRLSRLESLKQLVPSLSLDALTALITNDVKTALARVDDMSSDDSTKSALAQHIPRIYKEWNDACNDATILVLTSWWLELIASSLQGTLDFSISNAMGRFLPLWSPFGPPVEDIRRVRTGILPYMCAVTESMFPQFAYDVLQERMMDKAAHDFQDGLNQLHTMWKDLQTSQRVLDKAKLAKMSLMDAIVAMKAKQKVNVIPAYVQALLYLPGVLPAKRQVSKAHRWVQGCCAAPLGQSFEADVDWKDTWRDLHMIKQGLSRKRWSQEPRPPLRMHSVQVPSDAHQSSPPSKKSHVCSAMVQASTPNEPSKESQHTLLAKETWIPKQHMDMLLTRPMDVEAWAKTLLSRIYGKNKMTGMMQASHAIRTVSLFLTWISRITSDVLVKMNMLDPIHKIIVPMRNMLRTLANDGGTTHIFTYCFVLVCCLPSSIHGTVVEDPVGVTIQQLNAIRDMVYMISMEYVKNGVALTQEEIQRFITKKREQQKQISIAKMDILTTEDRQLLQDAKKLKLVKLAEAEEMRDAPEDGDVRLDIDGENEYRMAPTDRDDMNMELLDE